MKMTKYLFLFAFLILYSCNEDNDSNNILVKTFSLDNCENNSQNDKFMKYEVGKSFKFRAGIFKNNEFNFRSDTVLSIIENDTLISINGVDKNAYILNQITNINSNIDTGKVVVLKCSDYFSFYYSETDGEYVPRVRFIFDPKTDRTQKYKIDDINIHCKGYRDIKVNGVTFNAFEVVISNINQQGFGDIVQNFYVEGIGLIQSRNYDTNGGSESIIYKESTPYAFSELILE